MKSGEYMLQISKQEAFAMREIAGMDAVKKTYTSHPHYYLVESKKNLKLLRKLRNSKKIKTVTRKVV